MNATMHPKAALHAAALPFPTHQGTQAALRHMLEALTQHGRRNHLLTYAHAGYADELAFPLHRSAEPLRYRSLRSGPNPHKLLADAALGIALGRLVRRLDPGLLVAHHVEAAAMAIALPVSAARPLVFFAHTDLAAELPTYAPPLLRGMLARAGGGLDGLLVRSAHAVATVSPLLAERLRARAGDAGDAADHVRSVPLPWPLPAPIAEHEREESRASLALCRRSRVLLYAGNLDRYQGWEEVVAALPALRARTPEVLFLVATASDPAALLYEARRAGVADLIRIAPLEGEAQRRRLHAAADLAIVPRRSPGGLPIKLLDAMARGVACATAQTASAGLPIEGAVEIAQGNCARGMAEAALRLLTAPEAARADLGARARNYVASQHSAQAFFRAFDAVCTQAVRRAAAQSRDLSPQVF